MKHKITCRLISAVAALALVAGSTAPFVEAQSGYSVKIDNRSAYAIYEIHMSRVTNGYWGPDLLGRDALPSGFNFTFGGVFPGLYDLKLVDEDGDVCVVPSVRVNGDTTWTISDSWLLSCEFH